MKTVIFLAAIGLLCIARAHALDIPIKAPGAAAPKGLEKSSDWCYVFDKKQNFVRCETGELICYRFGKFENCYPKPKVDATAPVTKR